MVLRIVSSWIIRKGFLKKQKQSSNYRNRSEIEIEHDLNRVSAFGVVKKAGILEKWNSVRKNIIKETTKETERSFQTNSCVKIKQKNVDNYVCKAEGNDIYASPGSERGVYPIIITSKRAKSSKKVPVLAYDAIKSEENKMKGVVKSGRDLYYLPNMPKNNKITKQETSSTSKRTVMLPFISQITRSTNSSQIREKSYRSNLKNELNEYEYSGNQTKSRQS